VLSVPCAPKSAAQHNVFFVDKFNDHSYLSKKNDKKSSGTMQLDANFEADVFSNSTVCTKYLRYWVNLDPQHRHR
jgi:hypothetical protein